MLKLKIERNRSELQLTVYSKVNDEDPGCLVKNLVSRTVLHEDSCQEPRDFLSFSLFPSAFVSSRHLLNFFSLKDQLSVHSSTCI